MRGKVLSIHFLCRYLRDHPRVCGEKFRLPARLSARLGSPPRMRGKDSCTGKTPLGCRITPAYAGKSQFLPTAFHRVRDHPRVCGEKWKLFPAPLTFSGSPPRMRGKDYHARYMVIVIRDHPRVCGEKVSSVSDASAVKGSPPRMRGKAQNDAQLRG